MSPDSAWTPALIPVDPGTKKPPGNFIQGRHYEDFEPGQDYRAGWLGTETGHVTHPNVGLWAIDFEDVKDVSFNLTNLGRVELAPGMTLAMLAQDLATYKSASDPEHKLHIYVKSDEAPTQWATRAWPYDIKSNGFVRAEPAYLPTGVRPITLDTMTTLRVEQAIQADREAYRQFFPRVRGNGQKVTTQRLEWRDWHDDEGNPEVNFTCDYDDAVTIAGQLRNWYYEDEFDEAAAIFETVMLEAPGYAGEPWSQTFERQFWVTMEPDYTARRDADFFTIAAARKAEPSLPIDWRPTATQALVYAPAFTGMGGRACNTWSYWPDPPVPTLLDVGNGPLVRPGTLGCIHAEEKQAKTWVAMSWAYREAKRGLRVLYVDYENGVGRFAKRMRQIAKCRDYSPGSDQAIEMENLQRQITYMQDPEGALENEELEGYHLIFIDAAIDFVDHHSDSTFGDSMNSAQAVNRVYRRLSAIARATGTCIVLIDHSNSSGETSGSRRKRGALDWLAKVEKSDTCTAIGWTFDRDSEADDLPAVYLDFDGYQLRPDMPTPPMGDRLQEYAVQGTSGDVLHARRERIFTAAGQHHGFTSVRALARQLEGEAGMDTETWRREITALVKSQWLVVDGKAGISMGTDARDWMIARYTAGKAEARALSALNDSPGN